MNDGTFWEKVKPSNIAPENRPAWMNFDDAWVDELARGFSACVVFCYYPIFWLCYNQSKFVMEYFVVDSGLTCEQSTTT
jgi:POT family proton-dependent oligopeptide transporter